MRSTILPLLTLIAAVSAALVSAQGTNEKTQSLVIASTSGRDLFAFYCATCHGRDGTGNGPTAPALNVKPSDLTGISVRNGGIFPHAAVVARLTGDRLPEAHGSSEMPVWGPVFGGLDPNDRLNRIRLANIVSYLESIQRK
jgi:mono/diheme cytochrome c family protein